jgi:asparagine synthase (glutamine-hydrolysing)
MCGITGFFNYGTERPRPDEAVVRRMTATLAHRGPDDDGYHTEPGVALGFRRLSIVDLAGGHQPLTNEDGSLILVFNGEIYNHLDLRAELEPAGHRYTTRSDAEAVLHAYEAWGVDCLERLQGMFAFTLYDRNRGRLFAARDRIGIKPLYYADLGGTLVFGSEIKALLAHPGVPREADPEAAALFLTYRYLPSPHTLFRGIAKLPPGHRMIADPGGVRVEPWWDVSLDRRFEGTFEEGCAALEAAVTRGVRERLMSDVPLGALLSGGLDSSIVVALMAELHDGPVRTFSIGSNKTETGTDELPYARRVAETFGTRHRELVMNEGDLPELLVPLIWHMDEPLVEPAALPTYMISRLARETVTVALTGEGGDELFAGYPKYARDHLARTYTRLPRLLRESILRRGLDAYPRPVRRLRVLERSLSIPDPAARYASWFAGFAGPGRRSVLHPDLRRRLADPDARGPVSGWLDRVNGADDLTRMLYTDVKTYLADNLLMKMDRMSMATSVEARVPLLDHRVVELAFSFPSSWKLHGGSAKWILKKSLGGRLPAEILERPKAGFPLPWNRWFREDLRGFVAGVLLSDRVAGRGILDAREVRRIVDDHAAGRRDNFREIWTLVNLELWYQVFLDPTRAPGERPAGASLHA